MSGVPVTYTCLDDFLKQKNAGKVCMWLQNSMTYNFLKDGMYSAHHIEVYCKVCGEVCCRNKFGYGWMWLRSNGKKLPMTILCDEHARRYSRWRYSLTMGNLGIGYDEKEPTQLTLL